MLVPQCVPFHLGPSGACVEGQWEQGGTAEGGAEGRSLLQPGEPWAAVGQAPPASQRPLGLGGLGAYG